MSVPKYLYYKGQYYDVGTRVKLKTRWSGVVETTFLGYKTYDCCLERDGATPEDYIVEIVKPVYYVSPQQQDSKKSNVFTRTGSGSWNSDDDVFHGLLLYIAIMLGGIIFNDRWLIWIIATVIFFGWKAKK